MDIKNLIESHQKIDEIIFELIEQVTLDLFKKIAKETASPEDFMRRVRNITNVPSSVSSQFFQEYGEGGALSIEKAAKNFWNQHHK